MSGTWNSTNWRRPLFCSESVVVGYLCNQANVENRADLIVVEESYLAEANAPCRINTPFSLRFARRPHTTDMSKCILGGCSTSLAEVPGPEVFLQITEDDRCPIEIDFFPSFTNLPAAIAEPYLRLVESVVMRAVDGRTVKAIGEFEWRFIRLIHIESHLTFLLVDRPEYPDIRWTKASNRNADDCEVHFYRLDGRGTLLEGWVHLAPAKRPTEFAVPNFTN